MLGLTAPVLEGTSDAVLDHAVGHVPSSAWPGHRGTSVFSGHDVTWFSRIDQLKRGDRIRYVTPCHAYTYRVTKHEVVQAGHPVYDTNASRIVLDTCYPLNALYPTSTRYLVYASLASTWRTSASPSSQPTRRPQPALRAPAPPALARQGLTLADNDAPVGALQLRGSPSPQWRQSNGPLQAEAVALATYFGAVRSAEQGKHSWWADLAPTTPAHAADGLWGGWITGYDSSVDITLQARGDNVRSATLTATFTTSGSARPGTYHLTVTERATADGALVITAFTMRLAG